MAVLAEKEDPTGESRARDQGKALAGKSTLNRLELSGAEKRQKPGQDKSKKKVKTTTKLVHRTNSSL